MAVRARSPSTWRCPARPADLAGVPGRRSLLGVVVSFAVRYLVALSRVLAAGRGGRDARWPWLAGVFFSGMLLPLTVFPGRARRGGPGAAVVGAAPGPGGRAARRAHGAGAGGGVRVPGAAGRWRCWRRGGCCSRRRRGGWWSRVAETAAGGPARGGPGAGRFAYEERPRLLEGLRAYGLIAAMWMRSTMAYRASFVMTTFGNFAATGARLRRDPADVLARRRAGRLHAARDRLAVRDVGDRLRPGATWLLGSMDRLGRAGAGRHAGHAAGAAGAGARAGRGGPVRAAPARAGSPRGCWCWATRWPRWTSPGRR